MSIKSKSVRKWAKLKLSPRRLKRKTLVFIEKQRKTIKISLNRPKFGLPYLTGDLQAYNEFGRHFFQYFPRKSFERNNIKLFETIVAIGGIES